MPRNISKPFNMTLSLIDIEPLKPKYKCFFGEDVQLNITVTDENRQPLDLSKMSARVYYICDGVDLRQDDNITITDTMRGRLKVIVKRNYIRVGTNDVRVVLYDNDQEIMLQPATILCKATDISDVNPPPEDPAFDYKTEILKAKNTSINNQTNIGDISTLKTTVKSDLVAGINELKDSIETNTSQLEQIEIKKASENYVKEEISKAQLSGTVDTTNFAYNSDIEALKALYENIGNYFDYSKVIVNEYWDNINKAVVNNNYFRTDYTEVKPYRKMIQRVTNELYENYGCIFDKDRKLITAIKNITNLVKLDNKTIVYNLPSNAKYVIMNGFGAEISTKKSFFLLDTLYYPSDKTPVNVENIPINKLILNPYFDKFKDKTVIFSGDSICYGDGWRSANTIIPPHNNTGWASLFKEEHPSANVLGYGVGGTCIAKISGRSYSILERLETMDNNAFRVIFEGGINDCWNGVPLGKLTDTWLFTEEEVTFDEYTFYGALESLIRKSIKKWQGAKIGFIITHYIRTGNGTQGAQIFYMNAIKKVCDKWGIPYYDAYCKIGTNACLSEMNTKYFKNGDYTHPLESFYREFYAPGVISFVENM